MMENRKLFSVISDNLIKSLKIKSSRIYFYLNDENKVYLQEIKLNDLDNSPVYFLRDKYGEWDELKKIQSLFFDFTIDISNISKFFIGDEKVSYSNTILGIAIEWKPKDSKIKRCLKLGEISFSLINEKKSFSLKNIEVKYPNSDIDFYWIIYVKEKGSNENNDSNRFGNKRGLILGKGLLWSLVSSNRNSSMFPVEEISKENSPLWSIRCDFDNWREDQFSQDNLAIIFNKCHPLYKSIMYESETFDEMIFKEVLSSSFAALINEIIIISKNNNSFSDVKEDGIEESGSILAAMKYFKSSLNIRIEGNPSEIINDVKLLIDKEKTI